MATLPEERFKNNLLTFCDFVKGILEQGKNEGLEVGVDPFILGLVKGFIQKEDAEKIVTTFVLRSFDSWDRAKCREKDYFRTDGLKAFYGIPEKNLEDFNKLFDLRRSDGSMLFDESVLDMIWDMFESFIKDSVCFVHRKRNPDPVTKKYTETFFPLMKVREQVEKWGISSLN